MYAIIKVYPYCIRNYMSCSHRRIYWWYGINIDRFPMPRYILGIDSDNGHDGIYFCTRSIAKCTTFSYGYLLHVRKVYTCYVYPCAVTRLYRLYTDYHDSCITITIVYTWHIRWLGIKLLSPTFIIIKLMVNNHAVSQMTAQFSVITITLTRTPCNYETYL